MNYKIFKNYFFGAAPTNSPENVLETVQVSKLFLNSCFSETEVVFANKIISLEID